MPTRRRRRRRLPVPSTGNPLADNPLARNLVQQIVAIRSRMITPVYVQLSCEHLLELGQMLPGVIEDGILWGIPIRLVGIGTEPLVFPPTPSIDIRRRRRRARR